MWLQDLLPKQMPNARIMTFGYDGDIAGESALLSAHGLSNAAAMLLTCLASMRQDQWVNDDAVPTTVIQH